MRAKKKVMAPRGTVYALVDESGHPFYVGQTRKLLSTRFSLHRSSARNGGRRALDQRLRATPGASIVPLEVAPDDLDTAERKWISQMREGGIELLNIATGGRRGPSGWKMPPEARARISKARKGKPLSVEHRAKLSAAHTGVPMSEAHRAAIGRASSRRGQTEETKRKLSEARMGQANPMSRTNRAKREGVVGS